MIPGNLERIDMFLRREQYELRIKALREAGCECDMPGVEWHGGVGPYCRKCATQAKVL